MAHLAQCPSGRVLHRGTGARQCKNCSPTARVADDKAHREPMRPEAKPATLRPPWPSFKSQQPSLPSLSEHSSLPSDPASACRLRLTLHPCPVSPLDCIPLVLLPLHCCLYSILHLPRHSKAMMVTEIIPGLIMSDLSAAESSKTHDYYGITHVLSVMPGNVMLPRTSPSRPSPLTLQIPIRDTPFEELAAHLSRTSAFIHDALHKRGCVLVHCVQGMSRSASVVAAYLMAANGWSVRQAVDFVRSRSSTAQPNSGFLSQLQEYYDALSRQRLSR